MEKFENAGYSLQPEDKQCRYEGECEAAETIAELVDLDAAESVDPGEGITITTGDDAKPYCEEWNTPMCPQFGKAALQIVEGEGDENA